MINDLTNVIKDLSYLINDLTNVIKDLSYLVNDLTDVIKDLKSNMGLHGFRAKGRGVSTLDEGAK